ncbi:MAG: hypothetical protein IVW53_02960 [Chloroflexi bacterium]|nr:hypothetical protein [Chloroflexota bacterium]
MVDRSSDRWITVGGLVTSLAFLAVGVASVLVPSGARHGDWLPLHLVLAGGATTAIAAVAPFFSAASAAAPPADPRLRLATVVLVAVGAGTVTGGFAAGAGPLATVGGILFIAGCMALLAATLMPHRRSLTGHRRYVVVTYGAAVLDVIVGASLATAYVAGWSPIVEAWASIKPAHATLNLFGFVSLVIAGTLLHFYPTVVGARIAAGRAARSAILGLAAGPPLIATGFAIGSTLLGVAGAGTELIGAVALVANARALWLTRARWTTDPGWHRVAIGCLTAAQGWFIVGVAILAARITALGAVPAAWSIDPLVGPIVVGWVVQVILGSATHLVPAIGPGDPATHGRQRATLGLLSRTRLASLQVGTLLLTVGGLGDVPGLAIVGEATVAAVMATTVVLIGVSVIVGMRANADAHALSRERA